MEKKYQVFISSTFSDLKAEREKAINAVLKLEHIPIGMELFNAGDDAQWAIIQRAIDNTDYYILIIGFRYGSVTEDDISYTEKEYDYAIFKKVPVIAFIKDRKMPVTEDERESKIKYQKKLDSFISKVQKREVNYWKTPDELAAQITSSLVNQIKLTPRTGWVRDNFDSFAVSQEMALLSRENRELRKVVESISQRKPNLEITILNPEDTGEEAILSFKYQRPEGNIHVRPLTVEDDLPDEVKELVTVQDLQSYNNQLPSQEEIDDYNSSNTLYWNAKKNAHSFCLGVENSGNRKANDISIDLVFPEGLLAYYSYDIEDMKKPEKLELPDNPVYSALDRIHANKVPKNIATLLEISSQLENVGAFPLNTTSPYILNADRLSPGYYDRDHSIDKNHDTVILGIDNLIHTHMYTSDKIWFIATRKGSFTIDCLIMCEEYEEPGKYSFKIEIE